MNSTILILFIIAISVIMGVRFRLLTVSGGIAATVVGILTILGLHMKGLVLLGMFFASSSMWSKYKRTQKYKVEERHAKGSRRDWQQVLANGGGAAVSSLLYFLFPHPLWIVSFCIMIAGSNSDTWASEIGTLSKKQPLSVRTFTFVPRGTSGAISVLGSFAGFCGAFFIAGLSYYLFELDVFTASFILFFGFLGNIIDTLLGAFLQATYVCEKCNLETEKLSHCGQRTKKVRGYSFLNNDVVNFLSSFMSSIIGICLYLWLIAMPKN